MTFSVNFSISGFHPPAVSSGACQRCPVSPDCRRIVFDHRTKQSLAITGLPVPNHSTLLPRPAAMAQILIPEWALSARPLPDLGIKHGEALLRRNMANRSDAPGCFAAEGKNPSGIKRDNPSSRDSASAQGLGLEENKLPEGAALQGPEEVPHFCRGWKEAPGRIAAKTKPRPLPPFIGHGLGGDESVKAEPHLLSARLQFSVQDLQPAFKDGKVMSGDDRAHPHLDASS